MSVRFGTFEVDLEGRRLLKQGMPVSLREQSFQVLAALMERPGEIVTREELRRRLWSSDTFVVRTMTSGASFTSPLLRCSLP